jgi:predicted house-cleaning noncanonical NTP pyrophosphatase (MazG superfamily)
MENNKKEIREEQGVPPETKQRRSRSSRRKFEPNRSVLVVTTNGPKTLPREEVSRESVGCKAFGLSSMPAEWVPRFFAVESSCVTAVTPDSILQEWVQECLSQLNLTQSELFVRSSGAAETMRNRGRLVSEVCAPAQIAETLRRLSRAVQDQGMGPVHWVIQEYLPGVRKGHLSNERHLAYDNRDWVAEVELQNDRRGYVSSIGVRSWRDGTDVSMDLSCMSEPQITLRLRQVAMWATSFSARLHFEWVWTGSAVRLVQADPAESNNGVDPTSLRARDVPQIALESLSIFEPAIPEDYAKYRKLQNAKLYRTLGYEMPVFYILRDAETITSILRNEFSPSLIRDLTELTKRPLIIRTDGEDIPATKREMLPRSDELRSLEEAKRWLGTDFKERIEKSGLASMRLCLIAHHFIPSVASAWARAEPGKRMVRIESLWGLPEGLYWYSHDTFEVDTQSVVPIRRGVTYSIWERPRFKGTFIAPDPAGKWVPFHTGEPYDWRPSIRRKDWLREIASTTRIVADHEKHPVSVMWFIDNDQRATKHKVLPWFHSRSEIGERPKAAPRRKLAIARDHKIQNAEAWAEVKRRVLSGTHIERVVVEPNDTDFARDPQFAEDLARFAAKHKIVIELEGGILSHAYYILQREDALVECVDLFGAEDDVVEYNKLVRDKIPAVIESRGEKVEVLELSGDALLIALRQKLVEEAIEALDAPAGGELVGELADVQEVLNAIIKALKINRKEVELERIDKRKRRGAFDKGFMLTRTSTPHSLSEPNPGLLDIKSAVAKSLSARKMILEPADIPSSSPYRRPDLRNVDRQPEKLFTFETELNRIAAGEDSAKESISFSIPIDEESSRHFTLTVEFSRSRSVLRGNVRLRLRPPQLIPDSQLTFDFPDEEVRKGKAEPRTLLLGNEGKTDSSDD